MAAIDKIYINGYENYTKFIKWCEEQPKIKDKYGTECSLVNYTYHWEDFGDECRPSFMAPYYIDAYLIRNCPYDFIQEELERNYGPSYLEIKEGKLYSTPFTAYEYTIGKHFNCIAHPPIKYNRPVRGPWFIEVYPPEGNFMWYHHKTDTWDFSDEFVKCNWAQTVGYTKTIKSLKRKILKWKLPIGTKIEVYGRYIDEKYLFEVTK
jgi:hypothetical protein